MAADELPPEARNPTIRPARPNKPHTRVGVWEWNPALVGATSVSLAPAAVAADAETIEVREITRTTAMTTDAVAKPRTVREPVKPIER